jgi:hypothetical protein
MQDKRRNEIDAMMLMCVNQTPGIMLQRVMMLMKNF